MISSDDLCVFNRHYEFGTQMKTLRDGFGKQEQVKKTIAVPIQTFALAHFCIRPMCMQSIQLQQDQLQIAAHAGDARRPTRDMKK